MPAIFVNDDKGTKRRVVQIFINNGEKREVLRQYAEYNGANRLVFTKERDLKNVVFECLEVGDISSGPTEGNTYSKGKGQKIPDITTGGSSGSNGRISFKGDLFLYNGDEVRITFWVKLKNSHITVSLSQSNTSLNGDHNAIKKIEESSTSTDSCYEGTVRVTSIRNSITFEIMPVLSSNGSCTISSIHIYLKEKGSSTYTELI